MKGSSKRSVEIAVRCPVAPSHLLAWNELSAATFRTYGLIARRAPDGSPRFNLPQTVWFEADDYMNWTEEPSAAVLTLAVNVLTPFAKRLDVRAHFGATSQTVLKVAPLFAEAWLMTMPNFGGRIPYELLKEWM